MTNYNTYAFLGNYSYLKNMNRQDNKQLQYKLWYDGDIDELVYFYKTTLDRHYTTYVNTYTPTFLKLVPSGDLIETSYGYKKNNFTIYHDPIATNISRAMSSLLFSQSPTPSLETRSKSRTKEYEETLDNIIEANSLNSMLLTAGEMESYSGAVGFKTIIDPDFSEYPIIQAYAKEDIIVHKKYDKLVSIVFKDEYMSDDDKVFTLLSEYGKGYIKYKLVNIEDKEVELSTIDELKDLRDIEFKDQNGKRLDIMLAVYKENKPGAVSDYKNCMDDFQASDEIYSNMMNFIRKTGVKRVVSQSTLKHDDKGIPIVPSEYDSDIIIKWDNKSTDGNEEINDVQTVTEIMNTIQGYILSLNEVRENIARTVKLSIKTIMGKDESGANASDKALSIRENIDSRTRATKIISWNETLVKLYKLIMILNTAEVKGSYVQVDTLDELNVAVEFYNPATPTFEQMIDEVQKLIDGGLIDQLGGLKRLWIDLAGAKDEDEVLEMFELIYGSEGTKVKDTEVEIDVESLKEEDTEEEVE